ncbi:MAG: MFS transporter [Chloroflexi bacterium]|nr:MFS transporter [Chloroflexota bacterium]
MSRHLVFATVSLAMMLSSITVSAVAVALPILMADLNTSVVWAGWVIAVYQLVTIAALPVAGKASDALGRRRVFAVSVVLFCLGSLASAVAPTIHLLILSRALQAAGGAGFLPSAVGLISDLYPRSRARSIGLISSLSPFGQIIGPVIGGLTVEALETWPKSGMA